MRISDIIRNISNLFEKKRKNPIKLDNDSNLESNLKFLKVGDKSTPMQMSEDTINVEGNLNVNGSAVQTGTDAGATQLNELSDVTYSSGDLAVSLLDTIAVEADLTLDVVGDIELNADGGDINFKDDTASLVNINNTNTKFYNPAGADSYCQLTVTTRGATTLSTQDAADSNSGSITMSPEGAFFVDGDIGGIYIKEQVGASPTIDSYGSLRVEGTNPTRLYFTNDDGDDIQITDGSGLADRYWHTMIGGYTTNKTSTTNYYTFYRFWYENWANADSDLSDGLVATDTYSSFFIAPRAGKITNIKIQGYCQDTGATDPFKFYIYKGALSNNATSLSLTSMFNTGTITPAASGRTWSYTGDFSSNNTFAEDDSLFIFWKKDSNTGSQDVYWNMNINGEYT